MLFCRFLTTTCMAENVFKVVSTFNATIAYFSKKIAGIYIADSLTMFVSRSESIAKIKEETPDAVESRCVFHREALSSMTLPISTKDKRQKLCEPSTTLKQVLSIQNCLPSSARTWLLIMRLCFFIHPFNFFTKVCYCCIKCGNNFKYIFCHTCGR